MKTKKYADTKLRIAKEVSDELGIPVEDVLYIIDSVFRYLKRLIKNGAFQGLMLPYFGKFLVNPNTVHKKKHKKLYKKLKEQEKYDKIASNDNCGCRSSNTV